LNTTALKHVLLNATTLKQVLSHLSKSKATITNSLFPTLGIQRFCPYFHCKYILPHFIMATQHMRRFGECVS
jgi:hypothetical protein